jgi:capsular polysaccharide export protein
MKKILFLVVSDLFIPLYFQISKYLEGKEFQSTFMTFLPRENYLLKKNGVHVIPSDVYTIDKLPINNNLFTIEEVENILGFVTTKLGGKTNDWRSRLMFAASCIDATLKKNNFDAVMLWNGEDYLGKAVSISFTVRTDISPILYSLIPAA